MKSAFRVGLLMCVLSAPTLSMAAWDGVVDWAGKTELSTATSGVVAKVEVSAGERVRKGALLLQLEQDALRARLAHARAEMKHMKLLLEEAGRELERAQELYDRTLLADHDLNLAKIAHAQADAAYQRSLADYRKAQERLRRSELRAPFDAVVVERLVEPAETVVSRWRAEPMLILAKDKQMLVRFTVTADEAVTFAAGQALTVTSGGRQYGATVEAITAVAGDRHTTYEVAATFDAGSEIVAGMAAKVDKP